MLWPQDRTQMQIRMTLAYARQCLPFGSVVERSPTRKQLISRRVVPGENSPTIHLSGSLCNTAVTSETDSGRMRRDPRLIPVP
jgi:hypothetical protein